MKWTLNDRGHGGGGGVIFLLELAMTPMLKRIICAYGDSYDNQSKGTIMFPIPANDHVLSFFPIPLTDTFYI